MRTAAWKRAIQFNRRYSKTSWKNFERLFEFCCRSHIDDAPFFSEALALADANDWIGVTVLADSLSSQKYDDARTHFLANQFSLLVKKYPFPKDVLNLDPEGRALRKFIGTERTCSHVNKLFRLINGSRQWKPRVSRDYTEILSHIRSWIAYVLGNVPDIDATFYLSEFGPGASIGVHGDATNRARKILSNVWTVTPGARNIASNALWTHAQLRELLLSRPGSRFYSVDPAIFSKKFEEKCHYVHNNKIVFVPKTAKVARSIAIEPLLNGYLQKGVDSLMRSRLKRIGVDLSDQSANQRLARVGSLSDSQDFATIDLSSASDSLATEVVRSVLPPDWFALLNALRSKFGLLPNGNIIEYEKFCSMGNGFCFPLESLIFAAVVSYCGGRLGVDSLVYGDDIVIPSHLAPRAIEVLKFLGFKTNKDKTFLQGPFRESCGADWFGGKDVRPFTLDFSLDSLQAVFKLLNLTQRNDLTRSFFEGIDFSLFDIPDDLRFVRPFEGPSDTAVTVELDTFLASRFSRFNRQLQCYAWTELISESVSDKDVKLKDAYCYAIVYGALSGCSSDKPFSLRRKSLTKSRIVSGSGAHALWTPAHCSIKG